MRGGEGKPLDYTGSNIFRQRGVSPGDSVYVVTILNGVLYLLGKMQVERLCDYEEAEKYMRHQPWQARDHVIGSHGTPKRFEGEVPPEITGQLTFISSQGNMSVRWVSADWLDRQTLRGVREITSGSAKKLDDLIAVREV